LAKKPNYEFEKRKKEQLRKAKKEEKAQRRREAAARGEPDDLTGLGIGEGADEGDETTEETPAE
jgi:hypothetical protein